MWFMLQGIQAPIMQRSLVTMSVTLLLCLAVLGPVIVNSQPQLPGPPGTCNTGCCNLGRTVFEGACSSFVSACHQLL